MASDHEKDLAYQAGLAVLSEPAERRNVDACPFAEGTEERAEWLAGFADALDQQEDLSSIRAALKEARDNA